MNDYKDLAKKICLINDNKAMLKNKTLIGFKNLKRYPATFLTTITIL